jgi:hypothetical protein
MYALTPNKWVHIIFVIIILLTIESNILWHPGGLGPACKEVQ